MVLRLADAASTSESAWDLVWPLLLGAGLTLATVVLVQLQVVPVVESRKRRMDRWEADVLALVESLVMDYQKARDELLMRTDVYVAVNIEYPYDEHGVRQPNAQGEVLERGWAGENHVWRAQARFEVVPLIPRTDWLAERIVALNPDHKDIGAFREAATTWRTRRSHLLEVARDLGVRRQPGEVINFADERTWYEKARDRERSSFNDTVRRLVAFAGSPTPMPNGGVWRSRSQPFDPRDWIDRTTQLLTQHTVPAGTGSEPNPEPEDPPGPERPLPGGTPGKDHGDSRR